MYSRSAELYDVIYRQLKDYADEARRLAALIRALHPAAASVLDVACGTGEHALQLARLGLAVDGLDLDEGLLAVAAAKHPAGRFVRADLTDFALDRRYDVVTCLFGSIAYAASPEALARAARCLARHLAPGGLLLVEPFLGPGAIVDGRVTARAVEAAGLAVTRVTHARLEGRLAHLTFEYLVGRASGVEHRSEQHLLGLHTDGELLGALAGAGLTAQRREEGVMPGRPLLVGRQADNS